MNFLKGLVLSAFIHATIFGLLYGFVEWKKINSASTIDIDLKQSSLILRPPNALKGFARLKEEELWLLESGKHMVRAPLQTVKIEDKNKEATTVECPPPCPQNPSDWLAAASASRRPVWVEGMITDADYPQTARKEGVEGIVKAEVLIDSSGIVRNVEIIESSDQRFGSVVEEKLKNARFKPGLDSDGKPINIRMIIPVVFKLQ